MAEDFRVMTNTFLFCDEISSKMIEIETENFNFINKLCVSSFKIYQDEKAKLPYHINVIDLLHANENAHSRILTKLLQQNINYKFEILENFITYIFGRYENFNFEVERPKITVEKDRIDILVKDKSYAIIIENKVHDAGEQPNQLERYIEIVNKEFKHEQIFVLYLIRTEGNFPSAQSWGKYKDLYADRFLLVSYRDDILPWLRNTLLPNCRIKDVFLQTAIEQYIDHLEGLFSLRKINYKMNIELQKHIKQVLELDDETIEKNHSKLSQKIEELSKVKDQLDYIKQHIEKGCWAEWLKRLKQDFPKLELINYSQVEKFPKVGVKVEHNGEKFAILIEKDVNIYYGIGRHDCSQELSQNIKTFVSPIIHGFKFEQPWWYGWKYTSFENAYSRLKALIEDIIKL